MPLSRIKSKMEVSQLRLDSSAASTDVNERVLLDGTDAADTNDGYAVILEDSTANALDGGIARFSQVPQVASSPSFRARLASSQASVSDATYTKVVASYVDFDIGGYYDNATNYRYTPLVAGYYHFMSQVREAAGNDTIGLSATINLNGSVHNATTIFLTGASNLEFQYSHVQCNDIIFMNGSSDYVEFFAYVNTEDGGTGTLYHDGNSGTDATWWGGYLISRTS